MHHCLVDVFLYQVPFGTGGVGQHCYSEVHSSLSHLWPPAGTTKLNPLGR